MIRALLREPLLHVLVLGTALFLVHRHFAPPAAGEEIVVSTQVLDGLRQDFRRRSGRWPTAVEQQGLVDRFVDDEVLVREGLALGLDRGDIIVRRRLLQKMEFLLESSEPVAAPTDAALQAYLAAHADQYTRPARVSLTQVFVSRDRRGAAASDDAGALRTALIDGADPATLGDPFLHGRTFTLRTRDELAAQLGAAFADQLMALPVGSWSEPLASPYGLHLVQVTERRQTELPTLDAVREQVARGWRAERRAELDRTARERLRASYAVRVEAPTP